MRHYRRHSIVVILIASSFITPPDPVSMLIMSIPLGLLYEASIGVSLDCKPKKNAIEIIIDKKVFFKVKRNNKYSLEKIIIPIFEDLKTFEIEFNRAIESDVLLINSITKYMMRKKGKEYKTQLTLLSAKLCGEPTINTYRRRL